MNISTGRGLNDDCNANSKCYLCHFPAVSNKIACTPGLIPGPDSCYALTGDATTFSSARSQCKALSGDLAFVKDYAALESTSVLDGLGCYLVWLGATNSMGTWMWLDGTPVNLPNWGPGTCKKVF